MVTMVLLLRHYLSLVCVAAQISCTSANDGVTVSVRAWGKDAIRVQICAGLCSDILPGALATTPPTEPEPEPEPEREREPKRDRASPHQTSGNRDEVTTSGNLACTMKQGSKMLVFTRVDDAKVLLTQTGRSNPGDSAGGSATFDFATSARTVYGMGQNRPRGTDASGQDYPIRSLDVRNQTFDFKRCMANEGGATNSAPYIIGGGHGDGFAFG